MKYGDAKNKKGASIQKGKVKMKGKGRKRKEDVERSSIQRG
jgi:hypothetical protein